MLPRGGKSFNDQVKTLTEAGFPLRLIGEVLAGLVKGLKGPVSRAPQGRSSRPVVLPYLHGVSHNVKNVARRYDVEVVFKAPNKLLQVCKRVRAVGNGKKNIEFSCGKRHVNRFVKCRVGVVYCIPLTCGKVYIGQTGRCVNERLRGHRASLRASPSGHLAVHCDRGGCSPVFGDTNILGKFKEQRAREILEAFQIVCRGEGCISHPSIALTDAELAFLKTTTRVSM